MNLTRQFIIKKRFLVFALVGLFLLVNPPHIASTTNDSLNQSTLTAFSFNGQMSMQYFDYNHDGKSDMALISLQVDVTTPGYVEVGSLCIQSVVYWNNSQSTANGYSSCYSYYQGITKLNAGTSNITVYYGFGSLLQSYYYSNYQNANLSINLDTHPVYSNGTVDTSTISSPNYNFTITNAQMLDRSNYYEGVANSALSLLSKDIINGRTLQDEYKWSVKSFYNQSSYVDSFSGIYTIKFNSLSASYLNYTAYEVFDNGTTYYNYSYAAFPDKGIDPQNSYLSLIIPQNMDAATLQSFYELAWNYLISQQYSSDQISNITTTYSANQDYFGTTFSFTSTSNTSATVNFLQYDLIYYLPAGLLSSVTLRSYTNNTINEKVDALLISPNHGVTTFSGSNPSSTDNGTVTTTPFIFNPLFISVPIAVYAVIIKKRKK